MHQFFRGLQPLRPQRPCLKLPGKPVPPAPVACWRCLMAAKWGVAAASEGAAAVMPIVVSSTELTASCPISHLCFKMNHDPLSHVLRSVRLRGAKHLMAYHMVAKGSPCAAVDGLPPVAQEVGDDSEAAFAQAFKRLVGKPPAAWRRGRRIAG